MAGEEKKGSRFGNFVRGAADRVKGAASTVGGAIVGAASGAGRKVKGAVTTAAGAVADFGKAVKAKAAQSEIGTLVKKGKEGYKERKEQIKKAVANTNGIKTQLDQLTASCKSILARIGEAKKALGPLKKCYAEQAKAEFNKLDVSSMTAEIAQKQGALTSSIAEIIKDASNIGGTANAVSEETEKAKEAAITTVAITQGLSDQGQK